ncbi:ATPase family associated with various cellular activities (AAA) domain-containing protein [Ditylenchus destructor]|uniref:ATPase family associated with various cellular activities (AAA) domain-containing protein n=1 Tax=Ditylenchus destructor TaxID=166010 RepID=A0AAD4R3Y2_9BILA|nr:ATPase family associated with various cellular activities (AAA) domain-containing protein [Ditylenchus destructor]
MPREKSRFLSFAFCILLCKTVVIQINLLTVFQLICANSVPINMDKAMSKKAKQMTKSKNTATMRMTVIDIPKKNLKENKEVNVSTGGGVFGKIMAYFHAEAPTNAPANNSPSSNPPASLFVPANCMYMNFTVNEGLWKKTAGNQFRYASVLNSDVKDPVGGTAELLASSFTDPLSFRSMCDEWETDSAMICLDRLNDPPQNPTTSAAQKKMWVKVEDDSRLERRTVAMSEHLRRHAKIDLNGEVIVEEFSFSDASVSSLGGGAISTITVEVDFDSRANRPDGFEFCSDSLADVFRDYFSESVFHVGQNAFVPLPENGFRRKNRKNSRTDEEDSLDESDVIQMKSVLLMLTIKQLYSTAMSGDRPVLHSIKFGVLRDNSTIFFQAAKNSCIHFYGNCATKSRTEQSNMAADISNPFGTTAMMDHLDKRAKAMKAKMGARATIFRGKDATGAPSPSSGDFEPCSTTNIALTVVEMPSSIDPTGRDYTLRIIRMDGYPTSTDRRLIVNRSDYDATKYGPNVVLSYCGDGEADQKKRMIVTASNNHDLYIDKGNVALGADLTDMIEIEVGSEIIINQVTKKDDACVIKTIRIEIFIQGGSDFGVLQTTSEIELCCPDNTVSLFGDPAIEAKEACQLLNFDWDFQKMGIGGLNKEFSEIFRRAFASRMISEEAREEMGVNHLRGMVLFGPPGTGKTLIARKICQMLNSREPKIVNGPEIFDMYLGASEKNIRELFADAEKEYACVGDRSRLHVIIFDEFDAIAPNRKLLSHASSHRTDSRVVNQLLSKIDGVDQLNNILIIAMTNQLDLIDPAMLRPGRLELQLPIHLPDEAGRLEILNIHTAKMRQNNRLDESVGLGMIAKETANYSGAELEGLVRAAQSHALNRVFSKDGGTNSVNNDVKITAEDFEAALKKDIVPVYGNSNAIIKHILHRPLINWTSEVEQALEKGKEAVKQTLAKNGSGFVKILLVGPRFAGKTYLAATICKCSDCSFVGVLNSLTVGKSKLTALENIFADAAKSPLSCLLIDGIDRIADFTDAQKNYNIPMVHKLNDLLEKRPEEDKRLLVIATCTSMDFINEAKLKDAFNTIIHVPAITTHEQMSRIISQLGSFTPDEMKLVEKVLARLPAKFELGIGQLFGVIDSVQADSAIVQNATVNESGECVKSNDRVAKFAKNLEDVLQQGPAYSHMYA